MADPTYVVVYASPPIAPDDRLAWWIANDMLALAKLVDEAPNVALADRRGSAALDDLTGSLEAAKRATNRPRSTGHNRLTGRPGGHPPHAGAHGREVETPGYQHRGASEDLPGLVRDLQHGPGGHARPGTEFETRGGLMGRSWPAC